ncbi:MAG: 5,6-dimethylbenzimidazole synthase [Sinobacterium sp.]|nr:5,6-dimethylbenzimidazole synthase [Sinobacterium sp.]
MTSNAFTRSEIDAVYKAIYSRRDMRHFKPDAQKIDDETLSRLLQAAHHAPSVGYMQPWRFIRITDDCLRTNIQTLVEVERLKTAQVLDDKKDDFLSIKVEGILDCSDLLVVCLADKREQYVFGRRTMPFMDLASTACAIQNLWLASRAEGIGMGWVSIFDPSELAKLLKLPEGASPIAILCLGEVDAFYEKPMLETEGWDQRRELSTLIMDNSWSE